MSKLQKTESLLVGELQKVNENVNSKGVLKAEYVIHIFNSELLFSLILLNSVRNR